MKLKHRLTSYIAMAFILMSSLFQFHHHDSHGDTFFVVIELLSHDNIENNGHDHDSHDSKSCQHCKITLDIVDQVKQDLYTSAFIPQQCILPDIFNLNQPVIACTTLSYSSLSNLREYKVCKTVFSLRAPPIS